MSIRKGIRYVSTCWKNPTSHNVQTHPITTESLHVFDPDYWPWNCSSDTEYSLNSPASSTTLPATFSSASTSSSTASESNQSNDGNSKNGQREKKKRTEVVEENKSDGHAPIKSALSILMRALQNSSTMTTSLSDIDVTLFNFHSTKFAERLLNRNISSVVIVESSHVFSRNAKKFSEKINNVSAYRADIYTLMGIGRKKTALFPKKLLFADFGRNVTSEQYKVIRPFTLSTHSNKESHECSQLLKFRKPHLLVVLPTSNIQKTVLDSMLQHALLHYSSLDEDTIFRYGDTNLLTFLSSGVLSQYICSTDDRLGFLSHQHRRHSSLFNKFFNIKILNTRKSDESEAAEIPVGYPSTSFHLELPTAKRIPHEKKLGDVNLANGLHYPVQIVPRKRLNIAGKDMSKEEQMGITLLDYACFMTQIGKQPSAKSVKQVAISLWPESASSLPADVVGEYKIGQLPLDHLETIFLHVCNELRRTPIFQMYCNELKIKRAI